MRRAPSLLAIVFVVSCVLTPEAPKISGATLVGFFPPVTQQELDSPQTGTSEGLAHLQFAISDTIACLGDLDLSVRIDTTKTVVLDIDGEVRRYPIPVEPGKSVGAYLAAAGREPLVVYATAGPSSLQILLPNAAAQYFDVPECEIEF